MSILFRVAILSSGQGFLQTNTPYHFRAGIEADCRFFGNCPAQQNLTVLLVLADASNLTPVANAGPDQTAPAGDLVTLDGSGSSDPDNGPSPLTFSWAQTAGPAVTLIGATTATPTFTPTVVESYTFSLTVNDGRDNSPPDDVTIITTPTPAAKTLDLMTDPNTVWANGHEIAELTVQVTDATGMGVPGLEIRLSATPADGAVIAPIGAQAVTDSEGKALFEAQSTETGDVTFTATDVSEPTLTDSEQLQFIQRRVVVFVQGINTSLARATAEGTFPAIRTRLIAGGFSRPPKGAAESGIQCSNRRDDDGDGVRNDGCPLILNYSYLGGVVSRVSGIWSPSSYRKRDTARSLFVESIPKLQELIRDFAQNNPNTRFVIIGHSQGGLIALRALELLAVNPDIALDGVITLDGALGGAPRFETILAAIIAPWGGPAASDLVALWRSASDHDRQGTTASDNVPLVEFARSMGTRVLTVGSLDDCVWRPRRCGLPGRNNSSSQVVQVEENDPNVLLKALGRNCLFDPPLTPIRLFGALCIEPSHKIVLEDNEVLDRIVEIAGPPTVP